MDGTPPHSTGFYGIMLNKCKPCEHSDVWFLFMILIEFVFLMIIIPAGVEVQDTILFFLKETNSHSQLFL
jgi:hypothetical protein